MRKCILAMVALLWSVSAQAHILKGVPYPEIGSLQDAHKAAFAIFQTYAGPPQIFCDLTTGAASVGGPCTTGTTCDGVADTAPNFKEFNTWARANQGSSNQVVLTIANGSDCLFSTNQTITGAPSSNRWAYGIDNLLVEATGATLTAGASGFALGAGTICHKGLAEVTGCSARIQSVSAGATQITLTAASLSAGYISRFSVGQTILVGGLDIQGIWMDPGSYPPNNQFFDWPIITNINAGTGEITLDRPLTNDYLDTWPNFNAGDAFEADLGGPATIWAMTGWDVTLEYRGLTAVTAGQHYAEGRHVIFRDATFTGCCGLVPSQNETFTATNVNYAITSSPGWEADKLVGTITLDNATIPRVDFQSSSINSLVMTNSTIGGMFGSPKNSQISDTSFTLLRPGAWTNGASTGYFVCTRCNVADFQFTGGITQNLPSTYAMSGGVISFANTDASGSDPNQRIFIPGGNVFWVGTNRPMVGLFNVGAITQDATNVYIQTNEAGTYPPVTGSPIFRTHPAPQWTCDDPNPASDEAFKQTCLQAGAPALIPLGEYVKWDYAPTSAQGDLTKLHATGKLVSFSINVTQAYSGTGSATLQVGGMFNNYRTIKQSDWSDFTFAPQINLKQAGERIITPSGVTCNGVSAPTGCSGDSLGTMPTEAIWFGANNSPDGSPVGPYMGSALGVGTQPLFTITIQTDQGVVP